MSLELSAKEKIFLLVAVRVSHFVLHFRYVLYYLLVISRFFIQIRQSCDVCPRVMTHVLIYKGCEESSMLCLSIVTTSLRTERELSTESYIHVEDI